MTPKLDEGQQEALKKLRNGNILCGKVGTGKSRVGLAYYHCKVGGGQINGKARGLKEDQTPMLHPKDLYIITTAKKRDNGEWEEELNAYGLSTDPSKSRYGDSVRVTVDSWNNIKKYVDACGAFFLFDEQRVVGYGSWSKAFIKIARSNEWIFLTATPGDCWMDYLSIFIANGFFKNKRDFEYRHVIYNRYSMYPQVDRYVDDFILQRMRDDILVNIEFEKPTVRHQEVRTITYDRDLYRQTMKDRWNYYENKPVDNISELERCILSDLGSMGKNKGVPAQADYQYMQFKLVNSLRHMKNWGVNIVWTAWETAEQFVSPSGSQYTRLLPKMSMKIVDNICGLCDIVGWITVNKDGEHGILLEATQNIYAKNQVDMRKGCKADEFITGG